jgi:hypothetical protein
MMKNRIREVMHASLIFVGFFSIWIVPLLPAAWIYDRLAIHAAFGHTSGSLAGISVTSVEKPCTVTFSNGVVADVGYLPAVAMHAFHIVVSVAGSGFYIYKFRRQLRLFINATSPRVVSRRGAA